MSYVVVHKTMDFSETIVVYDLKLATGDRSDKKNVSVDIKTLSIWDCMPPAPGLYTCIKSWKKLYKIRLQRDFFETCNKWPKWQDVPVTQEAVAPSRHDWKIVDWDVKPQHKQNQNFVPKGLSAPAPRLYTCIKSWKKLYKIRFQKDFFETCNKWVKW